jgi:hypothetical protein
MTTAGAIKKKGIHFFFLNTNQLSSPAPRKKYSGGLSLALAIAFVILLF